MNGKKSVLILILLFSFAPAMRLAMAADAEEIKTESADQSVETLMTDEALEDEPAAGAPAEAAAEEKVNLFEKYPPQVKLSKWGTEIRINIIPDPEMGAENVLAVESVKLETEKGEYLGLKTFQPDEKAREAEFMINPEILKIENVKITVSSKTGGTWSHLQRLEIIDEKKKAAEEAAAAASGGASPAESSKPAAPKKKGWLW